MGFLVLLIKGFRNGFKGKCLLDRIDPGDRKINEGRPASPYQSCSFIRTVEGH